LEGITTPNEEAVMTLTDDLSRLSTRAKGAEQRVAAAGAGARGDDIQRSWNEHVQRARTRIDARKAQHDAKVASHDADAAADYAEFTIDFAYNAIEEAGYAVQDAVLASMDAEAAASKVPI
jgi:hypothetical protein